MTDFIYIDTNEALSQFCQQVKDCQYCALDTEFVREKTYYPILSLIQLATETEMACIDPLAVTDFSPLLTLFENTGMVKILHSPSQDLELFEQQFKALPNPVFDTQLAAAVLGFANQIGYADLVQRLCKVQLDKKFTRTDWSKRPLSEGAIDYAMDDVRYLIDMYQQLLKQLQDKGRWEWVRQDLEQMSDSEQYRVDIHGMWKRLKGINKLKGAALNRADQLCQWREQTAISKNRPRRWIIKDEDIVDMARFNPQSSNDLKSIGNLGAEFIKKNGDRLISVIEKANAMDKKDWPTQEDFVRLDNDQMAVADCLMAISRVITDQNNIALVSVASKKDIDSIACGETSSKVCKGWRNEMLGKHLVSFVKGEGAIRIVDGKVTL